jgi:hypothetical protein
MKRVRSLLQHSVARFPTLAGPLFEAARASRLQSAYFVIARRR